MVHSQSLEVQKLLTMSMVLDFGVLKTLEWVNPIELYDMMGNGTDWVNDWYSDDYYQHSPEEDPQGPETGTKRVVRGYRGSVDGTLTITRGGEHPDREFGNGFRCVENL
ncbi:SUMF1/EgtB/PvdO family nonheme iron enzyme [Providencia sp. wls1943]|nr:SUMF1/EgtB/PvdO family nonheme iron enzyme [Providencia sp. wls1943]